MSPLNLLTEEEARTKWCPETRSMVMGTSAGYGTPAPALTAVNHARADGCDHREFGTFNCIAAKCMHWRWGENGFVGHCGLSGQP